MKIIIIFLTVLAGIFAAPLTSFGRPVVTHGDNTVLQPPPEEHSLHFPAGGANFTLIFNGSCFFCAKFEIKAEPKTEPITNYENYEENRR